MVSMALACTLGLVVIAFVGLGRLTARNPKVGGIALVASTVVFVSLLAVYAQNVNLD